MVDGGSRYRLLGHLFQADGLGCHLNIVVEALFPFSMFLLHWIDSSIWMKLDHITAPGQSQVF